MLRVLLPSNPLLMMASESLVLQRWPEACGALVLLSVLWGVRDAANEVARSPVYT